MKFLSRCLHWIATLALAIGCLPAWPVDPPTLHALLVGIGPYQNADSAGLRVLRGPANDVDAMRAVLSDRFGLSPDNTTVLLDEHATRTALLDALKKVLVDDAKPGDVALFYFSGHGSRAFDASVDEPSKFDSTILPYDARAEAGQARDITDDELGTLVTAALAKGVKPIVILDSCNSGTGIRFLAQARYAPPIKRMTPMAQTASAPRSIREIATGYGILLAAAQDTEEALEMERDGVVHGEFTRVLAATLRSAEREVTYLDVLTRVRVGLTTLGIPHRPQGEGDLQQRFLGTGPLGRPPVIAERIDDHTARLQIGAASGVTVASRYDFFATAAAAAAGASPVASGEIEDVQPDSALVRLTSPPPTLPTTLFATERSHAYGDLKLRVAIVGGTEAQLAQLVTALAKLEYVTIAKTNSATHWLQLGDTGVQLSLADGSKIGPRTKLGPDMEESLAILLGRLAHVQALLSLTNPQRPKSPITASIVLASAGTNDVITPVLRDGEARLPVGQTFKVTLFNPEAKARHVYVLNIAPDLCVRLLSPPPFGKDEPLVGLARTKLLKAGPERGREYFLILATDEPVALEALQQPCVDSASLRMTAKTLADPLAQLLRNAGSARRAAKRNLPLDGWSTGLITMLIE